MTGQDNVNVSFLDSRGFWVFYGMVIGVFQFFLWMLQVPSTLSASIIHLLHTILTFRLLHWNKGSVALQDYGVYDDLTFWEQIDDGKQYTVTRKLMTIVPVLIFLWASYESSWKLEFLVINSIALVIILLAKTPYMYRVRILGINGNA